MKTSTNEEKHSNHLIDRVKEERRLSIDEGQRQNAISSFFRNSHLSVLTEEKT